MSLVRLEVYLDHWGTQKTRYQPITALSRNVEYATKTTLKQTFILREYLKSLQIELLYKLFLKEWIIREDHAEFWINLAA